MGAPPADPAKYDPDHRRLPTSGARAGQGTSAAACGRARLEAVDRWEMPQWAKVHQQVHMLGLAIELGQSAAEVRAYVAHDLLHAAQVDRAEHLVPVLGDEYHMACRMKTQSLPARMSPYSAMNSNMLSPCSSGTTTGSNLRPGSGSRWPGRSGAPGWCSTMPWPPGKLLTRPGSHTSPTGSYRPG